MLSWVCVVVGRELRQVAGSCRLHSCTILRISALYVCKYGVLALVRLQPHNRGNMDYVVVPSVMCVAHLVSVL